jgi:curli biogenesis system outer membrane secretion channel CsgG
MKKYFYRRFVLIFCIGLLGSVCAIQETLAQQQLSAPKKTIAVASFENKANYASQIDLGRAMAEMLTDALIQSGAFIVLERGALESVFAEQNLAASSRAAAGTAAAKGAVGRAQILVQGVISEFSEESEGGGQSLNIKGFDLNMASASAHVAVIIRLIDSSTSEVIASQRVEGKANRGGTQFGFAESDWGFSQSGQKSMPIDKAVQIAIDNAVNYISAQLRTVQWTGKVIKTDENGTVFINAGANAGLQPGMLFMAFQKGEILLDPDTGINLGTADEFLGRVRITAVQEKFSRAEALDQKMPAAGDIVKFVG